MEITHGAVVQGPFFVARKSPGTIRQAERLNRRGGFSKQFVRLDKRDAARPFFCVPSTVLYVSNAVHRDTSFEQRDISSVQRVPGSVQRVPSSVQSDPRSAQRNPRSVQRVPNVVQSVRNPVQNVCFAVRLD